MQALEQQARKLRRQGLSILAIATQLHVGKGAVADWIRDIPGPPRGPRPGPQKPRIVSADGKRRRMEGYRRYWDKESAALETRRQAISAEAASQIGNLTEREIMIAGAIAYWCEGCKSKPYRHRERVTFMNSDPALIQFFLRFLDVADVPRSHLRFRVSIHESADIAAAERFWQEVTGAGPEQFSKPVLKRHTPKTGSRSGNESYHGCLNVDVRLSAMLYRTIEGWVAAATRGSR